MVLRWSSVESTEWLLSLWTIPVLSGENMRASGRYQLAMVSSMVEAEGRREPASGGWSMAVPWGHGGGGGGVAFRRGARAGGGWLGGGSGDAARGGEGRGVVAAAGV